MKDVDFNLIDNPWIKVINSECEEKEISLLEFFKYAHEFSDFAGELPTQDVQIMRYINAIMHKVIFQYDLETGELSLSNNEDTLLSRWCFIWKERKFPYDVIEKYLERYRDRFWLFHPEYPFMQTPLAKVGTEYSAAKLNGILSESGNKKKLFPAVSGERKEIISYAEAARWLLYVIAYDDTSAKPSGYLRQRKIKTPSPGVGWLGKLGIITLVGNNLFETVMLNTVLCDINGNIYNDGKPSWEKDVYDGDDISKIERVEIIKPDNLPELYTIQSRRILLNRKDEGVDKYYLLGGEFFEKENSYIEPMTVWRLKDAKKKTNEFIPKRHDISKQFWREFANVFPRTNESHRQPGVIGWFEQLQEDECIPKNYLLKTRISSVQYGDKDFFVTNVFTDSLAMNAELLYDKKKAWQVAVIDSIDLTNEIAAKIRSLAADVYIAGGGSDDKDSIRTASQKAPERYYNIIDKEFKQWLRNINPDEDDIIDVKKDWGHKAKLIAEQVGDEIIRQAGPAAYIGKEIEKKVYSAAKARIDFRNRLAAVLKKGGLTDEKR